MPHRSSKESLQPQPRGRRRCSLPVIAAAQDQLQQQLAAFDTPVLFSVQRVYNGVAVMADAAERAALAQLPGVKAVHPSSPRRPATVRAFLFSACPRCGKMPRAGGRQGGYAARVSALPSPIQGSTTCTAILAARAQATPERSHAHRRRPRLSRPACGRRLRLCRRRLQRLGRR